MSVTSTLRLPMERNSRLSNNRRSFSTTPTPTRSNLSSSASVHRIYLNSACSNHIFPTNLPLKKIKPEPWQRFFDGEKRQLYSQQGLTVKKNKQNVDAIINEEFFNITDDYPNSDDNSQRPILPPPVQAHIDHLCEQIDDLALQLAEERLNHKQTRLKNEEILNIQLQNQNKQFQELLHRKMIDHEKQIEDQNLKHLKSIQEEQTLNYKREEQLKNELDFVKTSFHSYKINLDKDNEEKMKIKINEALQEIKKELKDKEEENNKKINDAIIKERKTISARQKMETENLKKQHQKEINTIHKTFADSAFDRERVETLSKELTTTKLELDDTKERAINLALRLKDLEIRHVETTRELNDYRTRFDEKTKEIEKLYSGRLDQLHLQNADIRNMYMKKCEELVDERTLTQQKIDQQVKFSKKQLQKKLLNIRIASSIPLNADNEPHRLSTYATASQYEISPTRCRSAFATSHPVSSIYNENLMDNNNNNNSTTDFTLDNTRRQTKLRRRASAPITEEEQDVVRYLTSTSTTTMHDSLSSKYNFENESTMIKNLSLDDLQQTFKS